MADNTNVIYQDVAQWQSKQQAQSSVKKGGESQSKVDIDDVLYNLEDLMLEHGIFHCHIHFLSNQAAIWHMDDSFAYRRLTMDELIAPEILQLYPRRPYFERSIVPSLDIMHIFDLFKALRFKAGNPFLRAASLNLVNGMVELDFSSEGLQTLSYEAFQEKGLEFWLKPSALRVINNRYEPVRELRP